MLPPHLAAAAAAELGAALVDAAQYEAHRIALGVPHGGVDFGYGDAFPHETDMDQLGGVDFAKGCYVGQEVVSRMEHRGTARTRVVPVAMTALAPEAGAAVIAGERQSASWVRPPPAVASPCCGSTAWPTRCRAVSGSPPLAWQSVSPSRIGRALPFPAKRRPQAK